MEPTSRSLAKNAYRPLEPGEQYIPYVTADTVMSEFTARAVITGILMTLLFSVAATYSGLKVAQVFEAAIPISILAVGLSQMFKRRNTILENVIIQSIGGASGLIVAGSIFTLPALYIMNVAPGTLTMVLTMYIVSVLGAFLGLLFLIPLRRYFVADMHGKLPFPEATAINEVFVSGEKGGERPAPWSTPPASAASTTSWPPASAPGPRSSTSSSSPSCATWPRPPKPRSASTP